MKEWFIIPSFCLRPGGREFELQIPLGQEYLVLQHLTLPWLAMEISAEEAIRFCGLGHEHLWGEPSFCLPWREKSLGHSVQLRWGMLLQIICRSVIFLSFFLSFFFNIYSFILLHHILVAACGIQLPYQGSNMGPLHRELRVLTTGPVGKSQISDFSSLLYCKIKHKEKYAKQMYS